jgi:Holliday junction resolvase RusA-like endonuclease
MIFLTLPLPPDRGNARGHWRVRYRKEQAWKVRFAVALQEYGAVKPRHPLARVRLAVLVVTKRAADLDNCAARIKPILDGLVRAGWLANDDPAHLTALTVTQETDTRRPRVEVTIEEVP